jgi:hypothetical protein
MQSVKLTCFGLRSFTHFKLEFDVNSKKSSSQESKDFASGITQKVHISPNEHFHNQNNTWNLLHHSYITYKKSPFSKINQKISTWKHENENFESITSPLTLKNLKEEWIDIHSLHLNSTNIYHPSTLGFQITPLASLLKYSCFPWMSFYILDICFPELLFFCDKRGQSN